MGNMLNFTRLFRKQETRILIQGLDATGKTTMLYRLKLGEVVTTIPTIGFNVETVEHKGVSITAWDVGGRDKIRPLWRHYYPNTDAIIFLVDSNDLERLEYATEELNHMLAEDELRECPVLVLANKQDLPNAASVQTITEKMGLLKIRNRPWYIVPTVATAGDGLYEGLDWLTNTIAKKKAWKTISEKPKDAKKAKDSTSVTDEKDEKKTNERQAVVAVNKKTNGFESWTQTLSSLYHKWNTIGVGIKI